MTYLLKTKTGKHVMKRLLLLDAIETAINFGCQIEWNDRANRFEVTDSTGLVFYGIPQ